MRHTKAPRGRELVTSTTPPASLARVLLLSIQTTRSGKEKPRDNPRSAGPTAADSSRALHRYRITTRRHSSTHKQATDTPPLAGFFLPAAASRPRSVAGSTLVKACNSAAARCGRRHVTGRNPAAPARRGGAG